ncbi:MAG: thiamine pyrophosphate-binding protein, partial [Boseongicola sp. SB0675_bin_26]|nr:thiamine pyrophosphate-binding protein [Boseongicola sp. SB0675_bin_26]
RQVVCFAGDGDFQMNCPELGAAMQSGAAPVIVVLNNRSYGTIRMHQERHFPFRVSGTELANPDFASLARVYGMLGEKVEKTADFAPAFDRALASPTGALLEIPIATEALTPHLTIADLHATPD